MEPSTKNVKNILPTDFTAKLTSTKFIITPSDKITHKKGTKTPCIWRWSIQCSDPGKYGVVVDLNNAFKNAIKDPRLAAPIIFEVAVRRSGGISQRVGKGLVTVSGWLGAVITLLVAAFLALPHVQEFISNKLQPFFPQIFKHL